VATANDGLVAYPIHCGESSAPVLCRPSFTWVPVRGRVSLVVRVAVTAMQVFVQTSEGALYALAPTEP
jgi:hypothetical protein